MYYSTRRRRTNIRCIMSNCGIKKWYTKCDKIIKYYKFLFNDIT
jgi:hypothetical protein